MSFASPLFLWYFLPAVLVVYWVAGARSRNPVLAVASLVFYVVGGLSFVVGLVAMVGVNFAAGLALDADATRSRARRGVLVATVTADLAVLGVWKYADFASRQIAGLAHLLGQGSTPILEIALPIGISFFTFHHISYVVDVYRGAVPAQRDPMRFATYVLMFPQLIAGPIVRYHEIADQLPDVRRDRFGDFAAGMPRFSLGLAKKVVVADSLAPIADAAFGTDPARLTTAAAWIGVVAYSLQIYFDFSGYSDMAVGLARVFGYRFPENFDRPYSAVSITDFWRRWHMSLSRWFRDYLYIPLGGNRGSVPGTYRNLLIVFVTTGLWHGAAWTFLVWGLFHGFWLIVERATGLARLPADRFVVARRATTLSLVCVGWVVFRSADLTSSWHFLTALFVPTPGALPAELSGALTGVRTLVLALACLVVLLPRGFVMGRVLDHGHGPAALTARIAYPAIAAPYAAVLVAAGTLSPFLYFAF